MSRVLPIVLHGLTRSSSSTFEEVSVRIFEELLSQTVGQVADLDNLNANHSNEPGMRYLITFDDGNTSDIELALPLLKKYRAGAVFFIVVSWIGRPGYLSWEQVQILRQEGMHVGSHSLTHLPMTNIPDAVCKEEFTRSREAIEDRLGERVMSFSFSCITSIFSSW